MMRLCETNFAQLRRLLPRNDAPGETVSYQVSNAQYRLTITESTRYTTLVEIEQTAPSISYWSLPSMTVRSITTRWSLKCVQASRSFASRRGMITRIKSCINATKSIKLTSF
jgi:uncharacterized protein YqiB (DUF1249 family)